MGLLKKILLLWAIFLAGRSPYPSPLVTPIRLDTRPASPTAAPSQACFPPTLMPVSTWTGQTAVPARASWWSPTPARPIHWQWQLSDPFSYPHDVIPIVTVYDIDGESATVDVVSRLHGLGPGIIVVCYFDAGVYESYRSDAGRFPPSIIGKADVRWNDSYWLDIRQGDILMPVLKDRMLHWCKEKGFDTIEPDETEVWSNDSGFPVTREQNNAFNQEIDAMAHSFGLSVGLKGNTSEATLLWPYFDRTLNEQCWQFQEYDLLKESFLAHN